MTKKQLGIIILLVTTLAVSCALIPIAWHDYGGVAIWLTYVLRAIIFAVPAAWLVAGIVLIAKK